MKTRNTRVFKYLASALTLCLLFSNPIKTFAAEKYDSAVEATQNAFYQEINRMINEVDKKAIIQDARNEAMDAKVLARLRNNFTADVEFTSDIAGEEDLFEVHSTVQRVGDIMNADGEISTLYVTAAVASEKSENGYAEKYGVEAYIYLYWIDNLGTDNELTHVTIDWETHGKVVSDRSAEYGVMSPTLLYFTNSKSVSISGDEPYNDAVSGYIGFVLGCKSSINVINSGTLKCSVHTTFL